MDCQSSGRAELRPAASLIAAAGKANPYRYTFIPPEEALKNSLRAAGVLTPLVVDRRGRLICGFRRLEAARELGLTHLPVREAADPVKAFLEGVWENLSHRTFTVLEKAFLLKRLTETAALPERELRETYACALGLPPKGPALERFRKVASLPAEIQRAASQEKLKDSHLLLLSELNSAEAQVLAELFSQLRPSAGEARDLRDLLKHVARREGRTLGEIASSEEVQRLVRQERPPRVRLEKLRQALRVRAFPTVSALEREASHLTHRGPLGGLLEVSLPPYLEGNEITLSVRVTSPAQVASLAEFLGRSETHRSMRNIFGLLRGER